LKSGSLGAARDGVIANAIEGAIGICACNHFREADAAYAAIRIGDCGTDKEHLPSSIDGAARASGGTAQQAVNLAIERLGNSSGLSCSGLKVPDRESLSQRDC